MYLPVATVTAAQGKDAILTLVIVRTNTDMVLDDAPMSASLKALGCPFGASRWTPPYYMPNEVEGLGHYGLGFGDGATEEPIDDTGEPIPTYYYRIREGVERYFITDVDNPGTSARAQSELSIMWDIWGEKLYFAESRHYTHLGFNHIPGGSNVLFMDGHVEFIRFGARHPVRNGPKGTFGENFGDWVSSDVLNIDGDIGEGRAFSQ